MTIENPSAARNALIVHPSAELYGSDRTLAESVVAMLEAGMAVTVALGTDGPLVHVLRDAGAHVQIVEVPVLRKATATPRGLLDLGRALPAATVAARRLLQTVSPDVVYVNTVTVPLWIPLARRAGARVLCHVHEAEADSPAPVRMALAAPLFGAHEVITNSMASREVLLASAPRLAARTRVIYNGVPGPSRTPDPVRINLSGPIRLALIGRLSPRKGTDVAVRALAILRSAGHDVYLRLVGDVFTGYEWYAAELRELAESLGVADRVDFVGVVDQVWDELAACDIAVMPSRVEPFGNVAVEAMLARRPLVASATQGLREIVRDGENALACAPDDPVALATAIERTITDWPAARARTQTASDEAHERFSPARYRAEVAAAVRGVTTPGTQLPTAGMSNDVG